MSYLIPLKDYQFTGLLAILGTVMWVSTIEYVNTNIFIAFIFAIGAIMSTILTLATFILLGSHVRFKD